VSQDPASSAPRNRRRLWTWIGVSVLIAIVAIVVIGEVVLSRAGPILKGRIIETLSTRFNSRVELDTLNASLLRGIEVSGDRLRIYPPADIVAAGATLPLIAVEHFSFHSGVMGLFFKPMRVGSVEVNGLQIHIPPREVRQQAASQPKKLGGKIKILVEKIICTDSRLVIDTAKPDKEPKHFELQRIELRDVGPTAPWQYEATLVNAIPRGDIHATGTFGPWNTESPGDSTVTGHYTFDHADLNTIKGIGGILSSVGDFQGQLDRIVVDGTTETPDFTLDTANHPIPLHTDFHAIVDGITGDTYLQPVKAKLRNSSFTASGAVVNIKNVGHTIDLDIDVPSGQMLDFLDLAVKTEPAVMSGFITTKAKLHIPPGKESVTTKLGIEGNFTLRKIHFTNAQVQDKVDMLSLRAQGDPKQAKPGASDVTSQMKGKFTLAKGSLQLSNLLYSLPGATVSLNGVYSLDGQEFDFRGKVRTEATISQMVASRWKSWMLKPIAPFFRKNGAGAEIPVKITGTKSEPKFGLDVHLTQKGTQ
jgi:hypothetical protein